MRSSSAISLLLVIVAACSNDTFTHGHDADPDVALIDAARDASADSVVEDAIEPSDVASIDSAPQTYCELHCSATFCDDYDDPNESSPWTKWSFPTPSAPGTAMQFDPAGLAGRGVVMKSGAVGATAFETKQVQGPQVHAIAFDLKLAGKTANVTLVRVQAGVSTFALSTDAFGGNFGISGDSNSTATLGAADFVWHHFDLAFAANGIGVSEDGSTYKGSVAFAAGVPTSSSLDVGIVVSALGGTVTFDNVRVN